MPTEMAAVYPPATFVWASPMKTDAATLKRVDAMSLAGVYPHCAGNPLASTN